MRQISLDFISVIENTEIDFTGCCSVVVENNGTDTINFGRKGVENAIILPKTSRTFDRAIDVYTGSYNLKFANIADTTKLALIIKSIPVSGRIDEKGVEYLS